MRNLILALFLIIPTTADAFGTQGCDSSSVFLSHFIGTDAATSASDEDCDGTGKHAITFNGDAQIDTAKYIWNQSILLDGTGDYLTLPDSADWEFGTADFTLDFWIMFNSVGNNMAFIDTGAMGLTGVKMNTGNTSQIEIRMNSTSYVEPITALVNNVWYHIALTRSGTNLRLFMNGTQVGSTETDSTDIGSLSNGVYIGFSGDVGQNPTNGWIDEVRITKGIARWTANFTAPTSQYCQACEMLEFIQ